MARGMHFDSNEALLEFMWDFSQLNTSAIYIYNSSCINVYANPKLEEMHQVSMGDMTILVQTRYKR